MNWSNFKYLGSAALSLWVLISMSCNLPWLNIESQATPTVAPTLDLAYSNSPTPLGPSAFPTPDKTTSPFPFTGLSTATPGPAHAAETSPTGEAALPILYYTQSGDTLQTVAWRFGVEIDQIQSQQNLPVEGYLPPGQSLNIPDVLGATPFPSALLPDSEVVNSPSALDFHIQPFISQAGGFLSTYDEKVGEEQLSAAQIIERISIETSINPRLLLAFLEFRSHWLYSQPETLGDLDYPIGFYVPGHKGLYEELLFTAKQIGLGYYGWRMGTTATLNFPDGQVARLSPGLNAGSLAVQYLFSKFYSQPAWLDALYGPDNFPQLYQRMFGDPWARAAAVEPLFPPGLAQPILELPISPGERWSFSGGPHKAWDTGTPPGAIDFSPVTAQPPCSVSSAWVTASTSGLVARSARNAVALDLDGDGHEQTGWVLVYFHIADAERVAPGAWVELDAPLGHPSCEGGDSTGTNVHLARKYNGEWLPAAGPLPFVLSGWEVRGGARSYEGLLVKGDQVVSANPSGARTSIIVRDK